MNFWKPSLEFCLRLVQLIALAKSSNAQLILPQRIPSSTNAMAYNQEGTEPSLDYTITPVFQGDGEVEAFHVQVTLSPALEAHDILLSTPIEITKVDVGHFQNNQVVATDDDGPLELVREIENYGPPIVNQKWRVTRPTKGPVIATYKALPRQVNDSTKNAPSFDLRQNFGGLLGSGLGFLAAPPPGTQLYNTTIRWNLSNSPPGTRAIWTWGEGSAPITKSLDAMDLASTYFMVGNVHSFTKGEFGVYWLGSPPFNTTEIASKLLQMFHRISTIFKDNEPTYRVFIRHNPFRGSMAGTALKRSFMFSYDNQDFVHPRSFEDYVLFLTHECVHNWIALDAAVWDNWYAEGMAEYYSLFLSHRADFLTNENLRREINKRLTMYYTNPLVKLSNKEASKLTWKISDAQRLPYGRGLAFALQVNALIQSATDRENSLDDLVLSILELDRAKQPYGVPEYLRELGSLLGSETQAQALYDQMSSGTLVVPPPDSLAMFGFKLIREDAPLWELGFDEYQALQGERIIAGLVPGSAAEKSGLANGDRILNEIVLDEVRCDVEGVLKLEIQRKGSEILHFAFIPRGKALVQRWIYADNTENFDEL